MLRFIILLLLLFSILGLQGQEVRKTRTLRGKIILEGTGAIGANIYLENSTESTVTDFDGKFSLSVPDNDVVLVVSYDHPIDNLRISKYVGYFELDLDKWSSSRHYRRRFRKRLENKCK